MVLYIYSKDENGNLSSAATIVFPTFDSDRNGIQTHNHLFCKRTLNHLAKLAK